MGRRKHAWAALYDELHGESPRDYNQIAKCERTVEGAAIEDFTDDVYERVEEIRNLVQETNNPQIMLGIEMVMRELRNATYERLS